jgi:hypothetical protein
MCTDLLSSVGHRVTGLVHVIWSLIKSLDCKSLLIAVWLCVLHHCIFFSCDLWRNELFQSFSRACSKWRVSKVIPEHRYTPVRSALYGWPYASLFTLAWIDQLLYFICEWCFLFEKWNQLTDDRKIWLGWELSSRMFIKTSTYNCLQTHTAYAFISTALDTFPSTIFTDTRDSRVSGIRVHNVVHCDYRNLVNLFYSSMG